MFHVEHFSILLCMSFSLAHAEDFASELLPVWEPSLISAVSSCNSVPAREHTAQGWQALIMGDQEWARCQFETAANAEEIAAMPRLGLLLCGDTAQREPLLALLKEASLNPAEAFYVETLLRFLGGDMKGAAEDFQQRAEQFRADRFSAYWSILLMHYSGERDKALRSAQTLLQRYPEDGLAHFLRALMEEDYGKDRKVTDEALRSARRCTEIFPSSAMAHQLYGHLLFISGHAEQSLQAFRATMMKTDGTLYYTAALYEATALWCLKQDDASLERRRSLNSELNLTTCPKTEAEWLWRWEVNTLPLRILITRPELPTATEIRLAKKAATPTKTWKEDTVTLLYRDTLELILVARLRHDASFLNKAEEKFHAFVQAGCPSASPMAVTCYHRAAEAMAISLHTARAELFSSETRDIWNQNRQEATRPASRLLPPIIPERLK